MVQNSDPAMVRNYLERVGGIEPPFTAWKAVIITIIRYPRKNSRQTLLIIISKYAGARQDNTHSRDSRGQTRRETGLRTEHAAIYPTLEKFIQLR